MSGFNVEIGANTGQFEAGMKRVQTQLGKLPNASNQATMALTNLSRVAQDAPYGFIGIANNINPLLESFQRLKAESGSTKNALKSLGSSLLGGGGLGLAVGVASSLLVVFSDKIFGSSKAAQEAKSSMDKLKEAVSGIFKDAGKEAAEVQGLIAVLKAETETRDRKLAAIKELQKIQPEVFEGLKLEGNAVIGLDTAYKNYIQNLQTVIAAKILQARLEQLITKQLELQGATATGTSKQVIEGTKKITDSLRKTEGGYLQSFVISDNNKNKLLKNIETEIADVVSQLGEVSKGIKIPELKLKADKVKIDIPKIRDAVELVLPELKIKPLKLGSFLDDKTPKIDFKVPAEAQKAFDLLQEKLQKMRETAQFVAGSISDAFGQAFDSIAAGKNVFESIGEALKNMVLDMIKAVVQAFILKSILRILDPTGATGTVVGSLVGHRAAGGSVAANQPYMVGEVGREMFVPSTAGRIVPTNQLGGVQSAAPIINFNGRLAVSGTELRLLLTRADKYERRNG